MVLALKFYPQARWKAFVALLVGNIVTLVAVGALPKRKEVQMVIMSHLLQYKRPMTHECPPPSRLPQQHLPWLEHILRDGSFLEYYQGLLVLLLCVTFSIIHKEIWNILTWICSTLSKYMQIIKNNRLKTHQSNHPCSQPTLSKNPRHHHSLHKQINMLSLILGNIPINPHHISIWTSPT